jgi:hypothetical protein
MRRYIDLLESTAPWPEQLEDNEAIADYIAELSPSYIDRELCAENFRGCRAILRLVPIQEINPAHTDAHERFPHREAEYAALDLATMPPLLLDHGVIEDGHHRYRVAKAKGASHLWCYEIVED